MPQQKGDWENPSIPGVYWGWKGMRVDMSPIQFLYLARSLNFPEQQSIDTVRTRLQANQPVDPLQLYVRYFEDRNVLKVIGHEGRHRALVAKQLGYSIVPVIVSCENCMRKPEQDPQMVSLFRNLANYEPE